MNNQYQDFIWEEVLNLKYLEELKINGNHIMRPQKLEFPNFKKFTF